MNIDRQHAGVIATGALLCAGIAGWAYLSNPLRLDAAGLVQTLPPDKAIHAYVDFALLRKSGYLDLLAGAKASEDGDYKKFVDDTGFDYRTDLDAAAMAFRAGSVYMAVRGKFDWVRLERYATSHAGHCADALCAMPASMAGRTISYYQLRPGVLALAVGPDERAVSMIGPLHWKTPPRIPPTGVWVFAPPFAFADVNALPAGSHSFLSPLARTQGVAFTLGPGASGNLELRMEAAGGSPEDAAQLSKQLTATTDLLTKMLKRDQIKPNAADLSGVLTAGRFVTKDSNVTGAWPIERRFVESLLAGKLAQ